MDKLLTVASLAMPRSTTGAHLEPKRRERHRGTEAGTGRGTKEAFPFRKAKDGEVKEGERGRVVQVKPPVTKVRTHID